MLFHPLVHLFHPDQRATSQRTDSLSSRPVVATGAYAQASYFAPLSPAIARAPLARAGWLADDRSLDPREPIWIEAGASLHLLAQLRLTLPSTSERRTIEGENAHGALARAQLRW